MPHPIDPSNGLGGPAHPIAVVSERTGLSRDVLRAWERRYGAVAPSRSDGGQRLYSDDDIERFRLLAAATQHGRNISLVAGLSTKQLTELVAEDDAAQPTPAPDARPMHLLVAEAMVHVRSLDAAALEGFLTRAHARLGSTQFLEELVPDLMHEVGESWSVGTITIAQEHLASATAIGIVLNAVRALRADASAPRLLVATPSGEPHSVGAALVAGIGALDGWAITYLGANVPSDELATAARGMAAQAVALSIVSPSDPQLVQRELLALREALPPSVPLVIGGAAADHMGAALELPGLFHCETLAALRHLLARVSTR